MTLSVVAPDGDLDLVHQVDAPAQLRPQSWVGQRFPVHASASGKALLATYDDERLERFLAEPLARFTPSTITSAEALRAELHHVRTQRYAVSRDEEEEACPASPRGSGDRGSSFSACCRSVDRPSGWTGSGGGTRSTTCCAPPGRSRRRCGGAALRRSSRSSAGPAAEPPTPSST